MHLSLRNCKKWQSIHFVIAFITHQFIKLVAVLCFFFYAFSAIQLSRTIIKRSHASKLPKSVITSFQLWACPSVNNRLKLPVQNFIDRMTWDWARSSNILYFCYFNYCNFIILTTIPYDNTNAKNNLNSTFSLSANGDAQQQKGLLNQNWRILWNTMSASDDCEYQMADSVHKTTIYTWI